MDSFERSQLRENYNHFLQAIDRTQKFRATLSSFVWDSKNREPLQKADVACIELINDFLRPGLIEASKLLATPKAKRQLVIQKMSEIKSNKSPEHPENFGKLQRIKIIDLIELLLERDPSELVVYPILKKIKK